jgi:glycosyltransferase involved in cell wall biosynthesis
MTGFLDFDEWAYLLSQVDAGFNAAFPDALIYFPNKIFYYLAAGAAVLNTIPGQCAEVVEQGQCGLNYTAGDPESCFRAIERLVEAPQERKAMGVAARRLAETKFDRAIVYREMTRFLEGVVQDYASPDRSSTV